MIWVVSVRQSDRLLFPMAALTHCHKHSDLKQHGDSISTSSTQGILKGYFLLEALRGYPTSLIFCLLLFICIPWLVTPSFIFEASDQSVYLSSYHFFLWPTSLPFLTSSLTFLPPSCKDHHIASGPPR